jgi:hypothetical protein
MNEPTPERRAYFASLPTPDLIVCATVEHGTFSAADLELIREELERRGIDPDRLAVPGTTPDSELAARREEFSGPLPTVGTWWGEGWRLFQRYLKFVALLVLVLFIPRLLLDFSLGSMHSMRLSLPLLAHVFVVLGFDALFVACTLRGLCRHMTRGHCSVGRAIALGLERWTWVFINTLKLSALALGIPFLCFVWAASIGDAGPRAVGIILLIYPGIHLLLRYAWVQPIAVLHPDVRSPLAESARLMKGRYGRLLGLLLLVIVAGLVVLLAGLILRLFLPGAFLEALGTGYLLVGFIVFVKTIILVGYLHLVSSPNARSPQPPASEALPPPPPL